MILFLNICFIVLLLLLLTLPFLVFFRLKVAYRFVKYLALVTIISVAIVIVLGTLSNAETKAALQQYGYSFNGGAHYVNVKANNVAAVQSLEASYMGIGWPLKALIGWVFYLLYILIMYPVCVLILLEKRKL